MDSRLNQVNRIINSEFDGILIVNGFVQVKLIQNRNYYHLINCLIKHMILNIGLDVLNSMEKKYKIDKESNIFDNKKNNLIWI